MAANTQEALGRAPTVPGTVWQPHHVCVMGSIRVSTEEIFRLQAWCSTWSTQLCALLSGFGTWGKLGQKGVLCDHLLISREQRFCHDDTESLFIVPHKAIGVGQPFTKMAAEGAEEKYDGQEHNLFMVHRAQVWSRALTTFYRFQEAMRLYNALIHSS